MKCPNHPSDELRIEYTDKTLTGFCGLCLKHYDICYAVHYMTPCDRIRGHEPPHRDAKGFGWLDDYLLHGSYKMRNDIVTKIAHLLWEEDGRPNGDEYRTYWLYDVGTRRMKIRDFHWWKAEWIIKNRAVPDGPLWAMGGQTESQQEAEELYLELLKKLE